MVQRRHQRLAELTPDQRIAAVGYAVIAGNVPDGAITGAKIAAGTITGANIAAGAIAGSSLANGSITAAQLANGAAAGNLAAGGQTAIASGGLVLSPTENPALIAAGYVRIGTTTLADAWQNRVNGSLPPVRDLHVTVWTGTEMIVWGG